MKKIISTLLLPLLLPLTMALRAQAPADTIRGTVLDAQGSPIIGASVTWLGTGIGAITDMDGRFHIRTTVVSDRLIISYISYESDTIDVRTAEPLAVVLKEERELLEEVELTGRAATTVTSRISALQTSKITGAELCKAACCNLSESFETNASVDVSFSDAATGAKTIKMLGLSGKYVQLLSENTPGVRGLAQNFGLEYTPGAWMESIQVSKGTSSVINGYEATTGQINVEYLKPQTQDPVAVNGMFGSTLRGELNATGGWELSDKVSTGVLAHFKTEQMEHDGNGDGFMDLPKSMQTNVLNRWYFRDGAYTGQVLVRALHDWRQGGQTSPGHQMTSPMLSKDEVAGSGRYMIDLRARRIDAFMKHGYVFDEEKGTSIGLIFAGSYHDQENVYGRRLYTGTQGNFNFNGIFQTNFTDEHKLVAGVSLNFDDYTEGLTDGNPANGAHLIDPGQLTRREYTPGVFAEYSYMYEEKLSLLLGLRGDWSSRWGAFVTPRFNIRYAPFEWWNLRASAGLGHRSPNLLSDFASVLPSQRQIVAEGGLRQETAVNAGASTTFYIPISGRELQITADYYYTRFLQNVVMDLDYSPRMALFYNSDGRGAYAQNVQVEASMEILRGWTMTAAFRYSDVKQMYLAPGTWSASAPEQARYELRTAPLTNNYKALLTTSYVTPLKKWQFDLTAQFNGGGRMPAPGVGNDGKALWSEQFAWHPQLMAQITRYFRTWSIYAGGENLTNFTQPNPIIAADRPYSPNFDASMAWGPLHGAMAYIGFRWNIAKPLPNK